MEKECKKVLVVMRGGVVQSIYSSDNNIIVDIFDFDDEELIEKIDQEKKFENVIKDLLPIY